MRTRTFVFGKRPNASSRSLLPSSGRACLIRLIGSCEKNMIGCRKEERHMQISKKIKLDLSSRDAATLEFMQAKCRGLYNWWVMRLHNGEHWPGVYAAKKTLKESRKY